MAPGKAKVGAVDATRTVEALPSVGWLEEHKGMLAAFVLSMLTAALFLLRSGPVASGTCSTLIMIQAECIKLVVALMYIIPRGQLGRITKSIPLALVPVSACSNKSHRNRLYRNFLLVYRNSYSRYRNS